MNKLAKLPTDLTYSRGLTLLLTEDKARAGITKWITNEILGGPLLVVVAGEWFPSYKLTRMIRKCTCDVEATFERLYMIRASTCYRLLDSLINIPPKGEPILVLDFLHSFYDADIPLRVRSFKLRECCRFLKSLAFYRAVIFMTQEKETEDYDKFLPAIRAVADKTFTLEGKAEQIKQPVLF